MVFEYRLVEELLRQISIICVSVLLTEHNIILNVVLRKF